MYVRTAMIKSFGGLLGGHVVPQLPFSLVKMALGNLPIMHRFCLANILFPTGTAGNAIYQVGTLTADVFYAVKLVTCDI